MSAVAPPRGRRPGAHPLAWLLGAIALALLSWATLPTVPSYDPYSWIIWGREVSDPHLAFTIDNGPSFKPLPFVFTVVFGLFGGAAPSLWVVTARVGGIAGALAAGRLAARLSGGGRAGALAGLIAAGGIVTTQDWGYYFMRGASEPGLIACALWAIDRLLAGRRGAAFWLTVAAGLIRPEGWSFLIALAAWLWIADPAWRTPPRRAQLLAGLLLVPVLWFGPPWIGSGHPLLAAAHAADYDGQLGSDPLRAIVGRAVDIQVWPLLAAAGLLVAASAVHGGDRRRLALGAGALAWWLEVIVMTLLLGFPGLERFYLPAAAVVCVLGGVGIVEAARWVARRAGAPALPGRLAGAITLVVVVAGAALFSRTPISLLAQSEGQAALARRTLQTMDRAVAAAGGRARVLPCPTSFVAVNHAAQPALAWALRVPLARVGTAMREPGLDFIGPANVATGIPAAIDPRLLGERPVAVVGRWHVLRLTDPHNRHGASCAGA
jgi:hypothetical protein